MNLFSQFLSKLQENCPMHNHHAEFVCITLGCKMQRFICQDKQCGLDHKGHTLKKWVEYSQSLEGGRRMIDARNGLRQAVQKYGKKVIQAVDKLFQENANRFLKEVDAKFASKQFLELERRYLDGSDYGPYLFNLQPFPFEAYSSMITKFRSDQNETIIKVIEPLVFPFDLATNEKRISPFTQIEKLKQLLPFKCDLKLKFQASKNKFLSSNMFAVDIRGPIILLVESYKGRMFGGYSTVMFPKSEEGQEPRHIDSFLFSLDHKIILNIKEDQRRYAVMGGRNFGFGRGDLLIADQCQKGNLSWAEVGRAYQAPQNVSNTKEWMGGAWYFRVLEYYIYEVEILGKK